jgi:hypothetical protein
VRNGHSGVSYCSLKSHWFSIRHWLYRTISQNAVSSIGLPRVTPEAKIRELCALLVAAENDEAVKHILADLRDAIHEYCQRLRRQVAQEMEREYLSSHKDDMAAD